MYPCPPQLMAIVPVQPWFRKTVMLHQNHLTGVMHVRQHHSTYKWVIRTIWDAIWHWTCCSMVRSWIYIGLVARKEPYCTLLCTLMIATTHIEAWLVPVSSRTLIPHETGTLGLLRISYGTLNKLSLPGFWRDMAATKVAMSLHHLVQSVLLHM